ncbi:hypothetical protein ACOME3_008307 [Neoechinorhynchus agilis]
MHGHCDLAQCFISYEKNGNRIFIDTGDEPIIIRIKNPTAFSTWVTRINAQRLSRQKRLMNERNDSIDTISTSVYDRSITLRNKLSSISNEISQLSSLVNSESLGTEGEARFVSKANEIITRFINLRISFDEALRIQTQQASLGPSTIERMESLFFDARGDLSDDSGESSDGKDNGLGERTQNRNYQVCQL